MIDHPYISDPDYTTTVLSWYDGSPHFFSAVPEGVEGTNLLNVFHVAYGTIFIFAWIMCYQWWKRGSFRVRKRMVLDSILVCVATMIIGGRLGEAIFYQPEYFFSKPWRLVTNASGFTIHGFIIGTMVGMWFWTKWIKRPWFHLLDQAVLFVAFGTPLGRIANYMSGDLWGRESDLPWATRFPMRGPLFRKVYANGQGDTFMLVQPQYDGWLWPWEEPELGPPWLEPYTPDQSFEILNSSEWMSFRTGSGDSSTYELVQMVVTTPRHPSQLYQAITEGLILFVILVLVRFRAKCVGTMSATFLVAYGALRMVSEFFRQPEPGLGYLLGLTRGQLLSLAMVVGGFVLFAFIRKKPILIDSLETDAPGFAKPAGNAAQPVSQ